MFTAKQNVLQLLALLQAHGISQAVLCPGSRDIPLVQGICQLPGMSTYNITDERSAGFFALGLALTTHKPCAVVVTSGSAVLNLHPAVAEAYYQQVPLLVISADRPEAWIGQMDGQTLPQPEVFRSLCKYSGVLPEVKDDTDLWYCNRTANEALLALNSRPFAPVQLNVPIGDPFFAFTEEKLPEVRVIKRLSLQRLKEKLAHSARIMLVLGQSSYERPLSEGQAQRLSERYAVYSEHISNAVHPDFIRTGDRVFGELLQLKQQAQAGDQAAAERLQELSPEVVITLGGHIVSKQLKRFLRSQPCEHIHISPDGAVCDLFMRLGQVVQASYQEALQVLCTATRPQEHTLLTGAQFRLQRSAGAEDLPFSQIGITGRILQSLTFPCCLHLANSSTIRYADYFTLPSCVTVMANRGVNGIEGSLSAAMGAACALPDRLHFVLIGDLSFFYDMNALWNTQLPHNLRLVLFNNGGGEIFSALPGLHLEGKAYDSVVAVHQSEGISWARSRGFATYQVSDLASFDKSWPAFLADDNCNKFMEVLTNTSENITILREFTRSVRLQDTAPAQVSTKSES